MTMRNLRRWGARLFARDPQIMGWLCEPVRVSTN